MMKEIEYCQVILEAMKIILAIGIVIVLVISLTSANKIIIDKGKQNVEYAKFAINEFRNVEPFNSTRWVIVYNSKTIKQNPGDLRIIIKDIDIWGYGYPSTQTIIIDPEHLDSSFLLFHELGHAFGLQHSQDNSIMDLNGGNKKYKGYQVQTIRKNIK